MKGGVSTPTDTMRSDEPFVSKKKNISTAVNHVWWPSKLYPKNNVYRVNVQLRTRYTGPDAADRQSGACWKPGKRVAANKRPC